jgi:aspartate aminotransferase
MLTICKYRQSNVLWGGSVGYRFAARTENVQESGIRKMLGMVKPGTINLSIGEPNIEPPANVRAALKNAIDENRSNYGPSGGIPELREAIAQRLRGKWSSIKKENVVVTVGATEALFIIAQTFYDKGDEVLVPDPGFMLYPAQAQLQGARPVPYRLPPENGFRPREEEMKSKLTSATRAIVVNSPSNPTGHALHASDIRLISDLARDRDVPIISDEVYDELVFDRPHESFLGVADKVVYVNSFSKTYSATGWRLGYVAADEAVAKKMELMSYHALACPPTMTQYAAIEALKPETSAFVQKMVEEFRKRRDLMVKGLNAIPGFHCPAPEGTIYVFPSYDFKVSSVEMARMLLESGVATVPGITFGAEGERHLRLCLGAKRSDLEEALRRMGEACKKL